MTVRNEAELRTLVEAIVGAVEEHLGLTRRRVLVLANDPANCEVLDQATADFPGQKEKLTYEDFADPKRPWNGPYDAVVMDYLPLDKAPAIALGMCMNALGCLMQHMFMREKPVYLLKKAPGSETLKGPYRELFNKHWSALASYGMGFLQCCESAGKGCCEDLPQGLPAGAQVCEKRLLSGGDVAEYAQGGALYIGCGTQVTKTARKAAQELGVRIVRV